MDLDQHRIAGLEHINLIVVWKLRRYANMLAAYYRSPIYLTGSALDPKATPRDWDLRIVMPDPLFKEFFGISSADYYDQLQHATQSPEAWKVSQEEAKRNAEGKYQTNMRIDFQIQPESYVEKVHSEHDKIRLDTRPGEPSTPTQLTSPEDLAEALFAIEKDLVSHRLRVSALEQEHQQFFRTTRGDIIMQVENLVAQKWVAFKSNRVDGSKT
jgi:hypothetical protein